MQAGKRQIPPMMRYVPGKLATRGCSGGLPTCYLSFDALLVRFWEAHDPTQGNRQGNDIGTQYRSAIYVDNDEMLAVARRSAKHYGQRLASKGFGGITTEIKTVSTLLC